MCIQKLDPKSCFPIYCRFQINSEMLLQEMDLVGNSNKGDSGLALRLVGGLLVDIGESGLTD